jgi:hypothetical protein
MSVRDPDKKAKTSNSQASPGTDPKTDDNPQNDANREKEIGGRGGLDPTRYGDWEKAGRCIDF